jgi:hypothetical protein
MLQIAKQPRIGEHPVHRTPTNAGGVAHKPAHNFIPPEEGKQTHPLMRRVQNSRIAPDQPSQMLWIHAEILSSLFDGAKLPAQRPRRLLVAHMRQRAMAGRLFELVPCQSAELRDDDDRRTRRSCSPSHKAAGVVEGSTLTQLSFEFISQYLRRSLQDSDYTRPIVRALPTKATSKVAAPSPQNMTHMTHFAIEAVCARARWGPSENASLCVMRHGRACRRLIETAAPVFAGSPALRDEDASNAALIGGSDLAD